MSKIAYSVFNIFVFLNGILIVYAIATFNINSWLILSSVNLFFMCLMSVYLEGKYGPLP